MPQPQEPEPAVEQLPPVQQPEQRTQEQSQQDPEHEVEEPEGDDLAPDDQYDDDADSTYGAASITSSSASLSSSIMRHRMENGRRYHAYKEGRYVLPNDENENERLELQHHMFTATLDGALYRCPAGRDRPIHRVLDCGTGTGLWAIDFADENPEAEVIGIDLSPIQPEFVPPNAMFYIDDLEEEWIYSSKFDFVHARMLTGSIADWPRFFQQAYENLNPGGWIELADITFPIECDDDTFPEDSQLRKWSDYMMQASVNLQRPLDSAKRYGEQLEAAGFENVVVARYRWPHNHWPKDPKFKELGAWACENIAEGASGLSMALFTRGLGWSATEVEVFLAGVRRDMRNVHMHTYYYIYVVYGQKPYSSAPSATPSTQQA